MLAMSGGVDSSCALLLLQKQGYEVIGATMRLLIRTARYAVLSGTERTQGRLPHALIFPTTFLTLGTNLKKRS